MSQVIIKRTYLYQPKEGTEQQSFAHVWLHITAAHKKILDDISTLTIQGRSPKAAWHPTQYEEQAPDKSRRAQAQGVRTESRDPLEASQDTHSDRPQGSGLDRTQNHSG